MTGTVVFFHAHPDDEAIFTGGTMRLLADRGARVVLVVATGGELGEVRGEIPGGTTVGEHRMIETERAAALLGVARWECLGYRDSGMAGDPANHARGSFAAADPADAAGRLGRILADERADALVTYDPGGIYGHPDHIQVQRVGDMVAREHTVETVYQATVDREYLHFVETHLVGEAAGAAAAGAVPMPTVGVPTVFVTTTVDVRSVLDAKRAAIAAHASQVPETSTAMALTAEAFAGVYGFEWYVREGRPSLIDNLSPTEGQSPRSG